MGKVISGATTPPAKSIQPSVLRTEVRYYKFSAGQQQRKWLDRRRHLRIRSPKEKRWCWNPHYLIMIVRQLIPLLPRQLFSFDSPQFLSTRMVLKQHRDFLTLFAFFSPRFSLIFTQGDFSCFAFSKSKMERCLTVKFSIQCRHAMNTM